MDGCDYGSSETTSRRALHSLRQIRSRRLRPLRGGRAHYAAARLVVRPRAHCLVEIRAMTHQDMIQQWISLGDRIRQAASDIFDQAHQVENPETSANRKI